MLLETLFFHQPKPIGFESCTKIIQHRPEYRSFKRTTCNVLKNMSKKLNLSNWERFGSFRRKS